MIIRASCSNSVETRDFFEVFAVSLSLRKNYFCLLTSRNGSICFGVLNLSMRPNWTEYSRQWQGKILQSMGWKLFRSQFDSSVSRWVAELTSRVVFSKEVRREVILEVCISESKEGLMQSKWRTWFKDEQRKNESNENLRKRVMQKFSINYFQFGFRF